MVDPYDGGVRTASESSWYSGFDIFVWRTRSSVHYVLRLFFLGSVSLEYFINRGMSIFDNFERAWSLFTGEVPYMSRRAIRAPAPRVIEESEAEGWTTYTERDVSPEVDTISSRDIGLVFRSLCELSVRINDALYTLYNPEEELDIQKLLNLHVQYLQWYDLLPEVLRRGQNFTPGALSMQSVLFWTRRNPVLIQQQHDLSLRYSSPIPAVPSTLICAILDIS